jgi:cytoskeletal protein RodZ
VGAFGEKLRQQREKRGLTIEAISNATKISPRMLLALEEERFDQLPGGVFNKGFVRAYARQLGLSEEETLNDYLGALRETQIQSQPILPDFRKSGHAAPIAASEPASHAPLNSAAAYDPAETHSHPGNRFLDDLSDRRRGERRRSDRRNASHRDAERPEAVADAGFSVPTFAATPVRRKIPVENSAPAPFISRRRKLGAAILLICAGLGGWISHRHHESTASTPAAAPATPAAATTTSSTPTTSAYAPPAGPPSSSTVSPKITTHSTAPPATGKSGFTPPKPSPAPATSSLPSKAANTVAPPFSATSHQLAVKSPATFTLTIRAEKTTWVSITSDGNPVAHETLIAPAHTSIRATSQIVVKAGNAAGVSFLLNGKEIPAQGTEGQVRTYTFNSTGLIANSQIMPAANR